MTATGSAPPQAAPPNPLDYGFQPGDIKTLSELVCLRAERDGELPFVTFLADGKADARVLTFGDLKTRGLKVAGVLQARGLNPGDRVLVMLPSGLDFIETFFGILLAGMTPVPVYPPARLARLEHYLRTLASITETASCRAVIVDERLVPLVGKQLTFHKQKLITDTEFRKAKEPGTLYPLEGASPAFLQFTSGTTRQPRGVLLLQSHVMAQLQSYVDALRLGPGEVVVSWLPLYHDLGLIGKVLACLYTSATLVLLSPIDFLKDPMCWLRAISTYKGVHVAAPNFAYQLCVRKCSPERLKAEGIDLSSVENAGMGGEPVSFATVEQFREHFASVGFRPETLNPCYGLAENTLVASGHRRHEPLRTVTVSAAGLQTNELLEPKDEADQCTLVGNGPPFPGMAIRIVDKAGATLPEDTIGEIWVQGPSLASGYIGNREATAATFVERDGSRWLRTGDLGFLSAGDLYICGRQKDRLIVRGRNFHPQDVEHEVGSVEGIRVGNAVAFSIDKGEGQGEVAIVVAELDPRVPRSHEKIRRDVTEAVAAALQLAVGEVILLPKGSVPKTSSGKLQRGLVKESYLRGDLAEFSPPGWFSTTWLKLRLGASGLGGKLLPKRKPASDTAAAGEEEEALDPRFGEALRSVRPEIGYTLTASLRVDSLGLDSLEQVELWLQLEKLFGAKVPEQKWSATQTLGDLQKILVEHAGTSDGGTDEAEATSLLVRELLAPLEEAPEPFEVPFTSPLMFGFLGALSKTFWRWKVVGQEHLDRDGGFLIAGNHVTYLDGAWVRNATTPEVRKRLTAYSYSGLPGFTHFFLRQMENIPIDPGGSFRLAIRHGVQALQADKALLIFPEGLRTHSGKMRQFRLGVGLLSVLSQKPIVPFRTRGMFQIFPRHRGLPRFFGWRTSSVDRLEVRFGEAIVPPPPEPGKTWAQAEEVVRRLREAVEAL